MPSGRHWDAVVIGSGFGGSTVALKLAEAGMSVLVLERGRWVDRDESAWSTHAIHIDQKYRGQTPFEAHAPGLRGLVYPNHTVGGNSVFYGAVSFRHRADDFRRRSRFGDASPERVFVDWPFSYQDLAPYYDQAERLLGVVGVAGVDPTEPPRDSDYAGAPPPYATPARRVARAARKLGLRPFPIPLAINSNGGNGRSRCVRCLTCDLYPCKIGAKNDLCVTVLPEAVRHGAVIADRVTATALVRKRGRITGVQYLDLDTGETGTISTALAVVSGGAIGSPRLLLASGLGEVEPNGGLIGRYLMRHCSGVVAGFFTAITNPERRFHKQVAITDFYSGGPNGGGPVGPWGMIQSLQVPPPEFIKMVMPFPSDLIGTLSHKRNIFLMCLAEDVPQFDNRVTLHPEKTDLYGQPIAMVRYEHHPDDLARRSALYRVAKRIMRKAGAWAWVHMATRSFSHAAGTCRCGTDPAHAVLDPMCRFFGIPNLFVVDASFMPTSGAVNPSLTIAANGLRVGEYIVAQWTDMPRP
ncbi:MAG: GMC family oxidoreductase [Gemmatimonadota bacterium]